MTQTELASNNARRLGYAADVEGRAYPVRLTFLVFDGDGSVGASDLLALLANWGPCP